jgi:sugar phosphate isomerase/epimerase
MKLAVSSWSLRSHINKDFSFDKFPQVVRDRYGELGVDAVELVSRHMPVSDMRHVDLFNRGLREAGIKVVNVPIDVGNISDRDPRRRAHDLRAIKTWLDATAEMGSPNARVNTGHQELPYEYASARGVRLLLENHGGISADPANIIALGEAVGWDRFATCPDFGNFPTQSRYESLALIAPYAAVCHAKALDLDENGELPDWDFGRCMRIMREAGFDGYYSAEFEGKGDQYAGVAANLGLIRRSLA